MIDTSYDLNILINSNYIIKKIKMITLYLVVIAYIIKTIITQKKIL